jgi:hypothetical protein
MDIKQAKEVISGALKDDPEIHSDYLVKIAMLIYDNQISKSPSKLNTVEGCRTISEKLIKLIFE